KWAAQKATKKMDDAGYPHNKRDSKARATVDAVVIAVNLAAMGAGVAAALSAQRSKKAAKVEASAVEKSVQDLNAKVEKISEQLRRLQPPVEAPAGSKKSKDGTEKKPDNTAAPAKARSDLRQEGIRVLVL